METYNKMYEDLINHRISNPIGNKAVFETHHIKPASMCRYSERYGERDDYVWDTNADNQDNLVRLSPSEHLKTHYYLWKMYRKPQMAAALRLMISKDITDDTLDLTAVEYENMRTDAIPALVRGALKNIDALIVAGKKSTKKRLDDGTHNFIGVMPWDNIRVKSDPNNLFAWEKMHDIHNLWQSNNKCSYRKLSHIAKEQLGVKSRLGGMVNIFNNSDRFHEVTIGWNLKYSN